MKVKSASLTESLSPFHCRRIIERGISYITLSAAFTQSFDCDILCLGRRLHHYLDNHYRRGAVVPVCALQFNVVPPASEYCRNARFGFAMGLFIFRQRKTHSAQPRIQNGFSPRCRAKYKTVMVGFSRGFL
jgi:hypothetical protein